MRFNNPFEYMIGIVDDIDVDANQAHVLDSYGRRHIVRVYPRRGGGPIPAVGESWIFDRSLGELAFHSMLISNPPLVADFNDLLAVLEQMGFILIDFDASVAGADHIHSADDITVGTIAIARLPVGTGASQVAAGDHDHDGVYADDSHDHDGSDITTGTVAFGRLPTGTGSTQVAVGNHNHAANIHIIDPTEPTSPPDGLLWTNPDEDLDGLDHEHFAFSAHIHKSSDQTLTANTTEQLITFDVTDWDTTGAMVDLANERIYAPVAGIYLAQISYIFVNPAPGTNGYVVLKQSNALTDFVIDRRATWGANDGYNTTVALNMAAGDYIDAWCNPQSVAVKIRGGADQVATALGLTKIA